MEESTPEQNHVGDSLKSTERLIPKETTSHPVYSSTSTKESDITAENTNVYKTSNLQCLMHILKGNLGPGILAIPYAVKNAGLWAGLGGVLLIGFIAIHCMHILVNCNYILCTRYEYKDLEYSDVFEIALEKGPIALRKFSKAGRNMVNTFLILTQLGFCCVYIVFISSHLQEVFESDDITVEAYMAIITVFFILLSLIKNLRTLAPFSLFANLCFIVGLVILYVYLIDDIPHINNRPSVGFWTDFPIFFGTAVFAFEGISLVLPLYNNIADKEAFRGWNGVLNLGMTIVYSLFTSIGFYGYLDVGDEIEGSITLNLPEGEALYIAVKIMFSASAFVSYGIQLYVPVRIIWPVIEQKIRYTCKGYGEYIFRTCLVLLTLCFALAIPHLDLMISLVGAFASSALALMFPPVIELLTMYSDETNFSKLTCVKDILIVVLGFVGFLTGTYASLVEIIETF